MTEEKSRQKKSGRFLNSLIDFIQDFDCNIQAICIYTSSDAALLNHPPKPAAKINVFRWEKVCLYIKK